MVSIEDTIAGPIGGRITDMATAWGALITATDIRATAATAIQATPVMGDMGIRPTGMADWVDCAGGDTDMHLTTSSPRHRRSATYTLKSVLWPNHLGAVRSGCALSLRTAGPAHTSMALC